MKVLLSSSEIKESSAKVLVWNHLIELTKNHEGTLYYKYPVSGVSDNFIPDFSIIDYRRGILIIDVLDNLIGNLSISETGEVWKLNDEEIEPAHLRIEDYQISLENRFRKHRILRDKVPIEWILIAPQLKDIPNCQNKNLSESIFISNYNQIEYDKFWKSQRSLLETTKRAFIAVVQGAGPLNNLQRVIVEKKDNRIGKAIKLLESKLAVLDEIQHDAAVQIPDGPQRIRGMAGTGKTIILTMKAAYLHSRYPDKKILYTFHTQSLYSQVRNLITKFYRENEDKDPDWDKLLVLHSWGGKAKEGVYYRTCLRNSISPKGLRDTPYGEDSFEYVCNEAIKKKISEEFDFVLMDESQDFPPSFFKLIYKITHEPKRIIFAYDELQTLTDLTIRDTGDLFGFDKEGNKLVDFSKGTYYGGIEMDFVLKKSYRNPYEILVLAHAIGMGIYNEEGIMQLIEDKTVWEAIGYDIIDGEFKTGSQLKITRPIENSVNLVKECYSGSDPAFVYKLFDTKEEEIDWITNDIQQKVNEENVELQDIIIISLNPNAYKSIFPKIQSSLHEKGIPSIIPGSGGIDRDQFTEHGFVTISTVFKAKGNEAFIIYVMNFDFLYDYVEFVHSRNRAFTALTRTKGWCKITGIGVRMKRAIQEIEKTIEKLPNLEFTFPDVQNIARKLSQEEHARRLSEKKKVKNALNDLLTGDSKAIEDMSKEDIQQLIEKLQKNVNK